NWFFSTDCAKGKMGGGCPGLNATVSTRPPSVTENALRNLELHLLTQSSRARFLVGPCHFGSESPHDLCLSDAVLDQQLGQFSLKGLCLVIRLPLCPAPDRVLNALHDGSLVHGF